MMREQDRFGNMFNLSVDDQRSLFQLGCGTKATVPYDTIHEAFENIVDNHPDIVAAVHNGKKITYHQLDLGANRLAHYLISSGLRPKERVCIVVQRSLEMLIGLLAVLKAGCQYVPIDGGVVSDEALRHIFEDTEARFVLSLPVYWNRVKQFTAQRTIMLELGMETGAFYPSHRPEIKVSAEDGLYAMYTSGSTGVPKGVDVKHGTMANALLLEPGKLGMTVGSKVAQVLSISFAMGAWEMLGSLVNGATLYLRGSDWNATLTQVDTLICTPSILAKYAQERFPNIKTVAVAGEACPQALADNWAQRRRFLNFLGATEVFLFSAHTHTTGEPLSIGRPLPNTRCYILDEHGEPVAAGERGTLWVGGAGVSKGYINLPLTTREKFQRDRFADDGSFMYNFGNIVCWRADGSLESFGRLDDQVKIKGFRVELDGVNAVMENFAGVVRGASLVIDGILHGFYTSAEPLDEQELAGSVGKKLPYYSVPERWFRVSDIPLNANGKVDKSLLKALSSKASIPNTDIAPARPAETRSDSPCDYLVANTKIVEPMSVMSQKLPTVTLQNIDVEKGLRTRSSTADTSTQNTKEPNGLIPLPALHGASTLRWLRHRVFIVYRRFLLVVLCSNMTAMCLLLQRNIPRDKYPLQAAATATAANLCAAILIRSEPVINLLFTVFSSVPQSAPLAIRRICANVYHIGGIHVGCAISAVMWFVVFTIGVSLEYDGDIDVQGVSLTLVILSYIITVLLLVMAVLSIPALRNRYHDIWESVHRFGGWSVLILYWVLIGTSSKQVSRDQKLSTHQVLIRNPSIWLIATATLSIIFPWLFLRRVRIRSEVLSPHATRLHFDHDTVPGKGVRLAQHPLRDWHGFATFINTTNTGYSVLVSRAGDFTGRIIDRAPTHMWRRGIPTSGVLRIAPLFASVLVVATGSGIGPCLSIFPYKHIAMRILWTAPNHEQTFGAAIVDHVRSRDPNAVIYNTRERGKPDMTLLTLALYRECGAEAVLVISNKRLTKQVVFDMEERGIPAYGAIFDS